MADVNVIELTWTELVNAFALINPASAPIDDGGGAFRSTVKQVYKTVFYDDQEPAEWPSLSVVNISEEYINKSTGKEVWQVDAIFGVIAYMNSNSDKNATNLQTQLSTDTMALKHDLFRVVADLSTSHINGTPRFIVNSNIKMNNAPGFGYQNKGRFYFKLPVQIRWYGRNLLPS